MRKSTSQSYTASMNRLKEIVEILESSQVDIDLLEPLMTEAAELIKQCQIRLKGVQAAVTQSLQGLNLEEAERVPDTTDVPDLA